MEVKKSNLQNLGIVLIVIIVGALIFIAISNKPTQANATGSATVTGNTQVINMTAKVGYSPNVISAKANTNTTLRVATNNTFDCSSNLRIPSLNINKLLPASGNTDIALGSQAPGTEIDGTCSMGMYSFKIKFS